MDSILESFGKTVARVRKREHLSQDEVVRRLRAQGSTITVDELNDVEHDRIDPRKRLEIEIIANLLNISFEQLLQLAEQFERAAVRARESSSISEGSLVAFRRSRESA